MATSDAASQPNQDKTINPTSTLTHNQTMPMPNPSHFLSLKLTPTNFLLWKTQFEPILISHDLEGLIDGIDTAPPSTVGAGNTSQSNPEFGVGNTSQSNPEFISSRKRDQMLCSLIIASSTEDVMPHIVGTSTSFQAWKALTQAFGSPTNTRLLQLHTQLQNFSKGDLLIATYLQKAKLIADQLAAAGKPLDTNEFNAIIFRNLGSDYSDMVTAMSTRLSPISYSELHSLLVSHEIRLQEQATYSTILPSANMVYKGQNSNNTRAPASPNFHNHRSQSNFKNISHQNNHRSFHTRSNSLHRGLLPTPPNPSNTTRCQICNQTNHLAATCRYRYDKPNDASAHIASFPAYSNSDFNTGFPDTGATHHVTPDLANLSIANNYNGPDQLKVGNGNGLNISHVWTSTFSNATRSFNLSHILHVPDITKKLLSVHQFSKDNNCYFEFHPTFFVVKD
ncbi:PREDICTED: uncharacterized protein LOC103337169 [Prunus mume]|uniref:Uncharacterized protein LOC103337169 n=1 Tax=Prunus mume TaxID=102107 RepID=A0ABM0PEP0_PRUMU|nr:PREDICTED: uncharacterized protein LOC103337169 [Prunus mume]